MQQDILKPYRLKPEILPEKDGSITAALNEIEIGVNEPTMDEAVNELVQELKLYAQDYLDRLQLFLNAPTAKDIFHMFYEYSSIRKITTSLKKEYIPIMYNHAIAPFFLGYNASLPKFFEFFLFLGSVNNFVLCPSSVPIIADDP